MYVHLKHASKIKRAQNICTYMNNHKNHTKESQKMIASCLHVIQILYKQAYVFINVESRATLHYIIPKL